MYRLLNVVTPALSKDLTTLARVKAELNITNTNNDALLASLITEASRAAAKYCHREFIAEGVIETFRPYPYIDSAAMTNLPDYIYLRRFPVISFAVDQNNIPLFTVDGDAVTEGTDFECDHENGRLVWLWNDMPLRWYFRKIVCQYTGGYTFPGTLEADIEKAVVETVKDFWFQRLRDPTIRSHAVPNVAEVTYNLLNDWPTPKIAALLAPYVAGMF